MKEKVLAYIFRNKRSEILVFDHESFAEVSPQVIGGTVDTDEVPENAVLREVFEESGLTLDNPSLLGSFQFYREDIQELQKRHVYCFDLLETKQSWNHVVSEGDEDKNLSFNFYWLPVEQASEQLVGNMGDYLSLHNQEEEALSHLKNSSYLMEALEISSKLGIQNWGLGAGCITQTVWNGLTQKEVLHGIKDIDWVYFDDSDLSYEAENAVIETVQSALGHLPIEIDVKNQARVYLWYNKKFDIELKPFNSLVDAMGTWPTTASTILLSKTKEGELSLQSSYGLTDLLNLKIRPNRRLINSEIYELKVSRWKKLWSKLQVLEW